ncbi:unnamed protein product [Closterium sp. Naga37s-1]|nr:unnamed protein product [Closterium sp. Naga37s-1]
MTSRSPASRACPSGTCPPLAACRAPGRLPFAAGRSVSCDDVSARKQWDGEVRGAGRGCAIVGGKGGRRGHSLPSDILSDSEKRLPPMHYGPRLPAQAGRKQCVNGFHCDSPGAVLVVCVGGSNGSDACHRLQWFSCCICEACDPCQPCDSDLCGCCGPKASPFRWRRLPPLPPTNPHAHPACYGAAAAVIPGTGFAIVGGAVPSQSGRPQHVRHVSVFDWHMGAWFAVQQPCVLPRLDPVVAAMGGVRWNGGQRDCLMVVGGCPVPLFPHWSSGGSCGRFAVRPSDTGVVKQHPVFSPPGASPSLPRGSASPSSHSRHPSPYFAINPGGFNFHTHWPAPPAHMAHGPGNRVIGPGGTGDGGGSGSGSGFNRSMLSDAGVLEADWESPEMWRVVEECDAIHAIWTRTHVAQVIVADVTGEDAVTVTDMNAADNVTVAGVTESDVTAEPAAEEDSTRAGTSTPWQASGIGKLEQQPPGSHSSRAAPHAAPATYSVLCSLNPNHSLLVFNHLQRKWVPAGPPIPPPSPPRPPRPRHSPGVLYPSGIAWCGSGSGSGSEEGHSSAPSCPPTPRCAPMPLSPPCTPTAPFSARSAALNSRLPSCASNGAASRLVVGSNSAAANAANSADGANSGRLWQLVGCGGRLLALFQPHDPRLPGPCTIVSPPAAQAQASGSVPVAAGRESMQLMNSDSMEGRSGWAMGAPVALPGNGRLHHVLSMHAAVYEH